MNHKALPGMVLLVVFLTTATLACGFLDGDGPPGDAVQIDVTANSSLDGWLSTAAASFNEAELETSEGHPVYVNLTLTDAGQAVTDIVGGSQVPDLWVPDESVWVNILADQGNPGYQADCESLATSPLVIAMWRPAAESLGWPALPLGWLDVGSLAADPTAWRYYTNGDFGDDLRLSHTHPGLSGSGTSALLAIVQAAQSKTDAVTAEDIGQPIVQASVSAIEAAVAWFSSSTGSLGKTMSDRGQQFLGAAIMYESDVVGSGSTDIVPIYPLEGTFMASHPACVNSGAEGENQEASRLFRDYLLDVEAQQQALANGLRPENSDVEPGPPLDEAHGVSLDQPAVIFAPPSVESVYAVQELWQSARKDINLMMLLDVSGSMEGQKIANMRDAAVQFVQQMGDDDRISIIAFSHNLQLIARDLRVGDSRESIISAIESLDAGGDTALYDAIAEGANLIAQTTSPETSNALVVLSDGQDTYSFRGFDQDLISAAAANNTTVFTIAYGSDADEDILSSLALGANGNFFQGDTASIAAIYQEMSAAFGGSVGVGR